MSQVNYVLPINPNFNPDLQESTGGVTGCGGIKSPVQGYNFTPFKGGSKKRKRGPRRKSRKTSKRRRKKSRKRRKKSKRRRKK
jgi:hypothetical protein